MLERGLSPARGQSGTAWQRLWPRLTPYALVAPAVAVLGVTLLYPILYNVYTSFFRWNLLESPAPTRWAGLENYAATLGSPAVWNALGVTARFTVLAVGLEFALGLGLALLLSTPVAGRAVWRTLLLVPLMATPLVVGLIWSLMWHSDYGVVNYLTSLLGFNSVAWLADPATAFAAILATEVWTSTAFVYLILLGAMQILPAEPYEAATVDGASYWQQVRFITLPLLRPAILVALLFRTVFALRMFDQVWALTKGGPESATETVSVLIYKAAFQNLEVSQAATISVILLLLSSLFAFALIRTLYRREA